MLAACLAACDRSDNNDKFITYIVSTATDSNGSITPGSVAVTAGQSAHFIVRPDSGYRIDNVSGCGGRLNGSTYITSDINAACTVGATFVVADTVGIIAPM